MAVRDVAASLTIHQLQVFLAVARSESLTDAALQLGLATATLSEHVKGLERVLGARLFDRSAGRRGFKLTPAGEVWAGAAAKVLDALREAQERAAELLAPDAARVRFGCGSSFGSRVLPGAYAAFRERWPQVDIEPHLDSRPALIEDLRRDRLDLAVVLGRPRDPSLAAKPLGIGMDVVIVARADHPWADGRMVPFAVLDDQTFVLPTKSTMHRELFDRLLTEAGIKVNVRWEMDSAQALLQAVVSGMGVTAIDKDQAAPFVARGEVAVLNVDGFPLHSDWCICWRANDSRPAILRLRDFFVEHTTNVW